MTSARPQLSFPAVFMRGGTSKGLFLRGGVLPEEQAERDRVLLRALGGGDPYRSEIDGLGGATSSTSKAVVVSRSARDGFDVDYLFAQVEVDRPVVDWRGSCGNLASAVGPFAIDEGLTPATDPLTVVRIWQVNTAKAIVAHIPTADGRARVDGETYIDGVPYPAAPIRLDFLDPGGTVTGALLPTGRVVDQLDVPGVGSVAATLLDAGNPCVFVAASSLGFEGTEGPSQVNADLSALDRVEAVRRAAAVAMGIVGSPEEAAGSQAVPKIAIVAAPHGWTTATGRVVPETAVDLVVRMFSVGRLHHALPGTGGVAIGLAALLEGTIPHGLTRPPEGGHVRIGHSSGVIEVEAVLDRVGDTWVARQVSVWRTARRLMEGSVLVPDGSSPAAVQG